MAKQSLGLKPNQPNQPNQRIKEATLVTDSDIALLMGKSQSAYLFAMMLTLKRPAHTEGERMAGALVEGFLAHNNIAYSVDPAGNIIADLRDGTSNVLFSSHYDSAHRGEQPNGYTNKVSLSHDGSHFRGVDACIGADDASGIFVMARMIEAGVPALYIFHAAEEVGGVGSHYIADHTPEVLDGITHAIAFDRRGTRDIIWQQGGQTCASEGTAGVFAHLLNQAHPALDYRPDDGGSFTDTKLYRHLVPECFNVSVGYDNEHTSEETQDIQHLLDLANACRLLDWSALPVWRDPTDDYYDQSWDALRYGYGLSSRSTRYDSNSFSLDSFSLDDWKIKDTIDPASFSDWYDFILTDFDMAVEHAYDVAELKDAWYIDTMWDTHGPELDAAIIQWVAHANLKYPLQGETK
jgi:hypothetical protein